MSYQLLSETRPKARKQYACIWCREKIAVGESHVYAVGSYYRELQSNRWHPECYDAANRYFRESGEEEFTPHECKRGSTDAA